MLWLSTWNQFQKKVCTHTRMVGKDYRRDPWHIEYSHSCMKYQYNGQKFQVERRVILICSCLCCCFANLNQEPRVSRVE